MAVTKINVNKNALLKEMVRGKNAIVMNKLIKSHYNKKAKTAQKKLLADFDKNEVTQELSGANPEKNSNVSNTLSGYGNLFSFIGFTLGSDPISKIRAVLAAPIDVKVRNYGNGKFSINTGMVSKEELYKIKAAQIPWQTGRSWLDGIEFGIAGFGRYLHSYSGRFNSPDPSKSKHGIQLKKSRGGSFSNRSYMSPMFKEFIKNLNK